MKTALCMVCGGFCRAFARTRRRRGSGPPVPRLEQRVRHRAARSAGAPDDARSRRRRRRRPPRRTPAVSPAARPRSANGIASSRIVPAATAAPPRPAFDPMRLARRWRSQNVPVSRPAVCRTENRTPAGRQELQRELAAVGQQVDRPARRRRPGRTGGRGRSRTGPASRAPRPALGLVHRARRRRGPRARRRPAIRSSWSPRRRASARCRPVGVGLRRPARRPSRCCVTNSSSGTGLPSSR